MGHFIALHGQDQLGQMMLTLSASCRLARGLHCGQHERNQNPDNRNDNQQFDQGKTSLTKTYHGAAPKPERGISVSILCVLAKGEDRPRHWASIRTSLVVDSSDGSTISTVSLPVQSWTGFAGGDPVKSV